ncbi:MAG: response regulator transcription factor [Clostridia bacterium]|nr:response regulator transcription factor [Clostridia bacterium]
MLKIAIADDQVLLREMLKMVLSSDNEFEIAGLAGDGEEILDICRRNKPDIVLLDIKMPFKDGFFALDSIKNEMPDIKVIMLTTFGDERNVLEAYKKGANGYVLKDIKPELLIKTIKCVSEGLFIMQDEIAGLVRKRIKLPAAKKTIEHEAYEQFYDKYGLDAVDRKIVRLLTDGKSNKEIGEAINYSEGSVKNRISRILDATGLKDRTQIAVFALQNNII